MKEVVFTARQNRLYHLLEVFLFEKKSLGLFKKLFGKSADLSLDKVSEIRGISHKSGFYIYGKTGSGKTSIMNKVFEEFTVRKGRGINMHFYDYFIDISRLLVKYNMDKLVRKIAQNVECIFFDEFNIDNITDGILLWELFKKLDDAGVRIILTSNFEPSVLFVGGFNRERLFPEFSNFLYKNFHVIHLEGSVDYRVESKNVSLSIICSVENIKHIANERCGDIDKILFVSLGELLQNPLSTRDLVEIVRKYHLICLCDFVVFDENNEDVAIRFRNLIDVMYVRSCNILISPRNDIALRVDEIFVERLKEKVQYRRALSRLYEMSWEGYIYSKDNQQKRLWADGARDFFDKL